MTTYTIQKWHETIDCLNILRPIFTFVPDDLFIEYILTNTNPIMITITNCPVYNKGIYYANCISSADFPSFGPNYYEITKEYVMVLLTPFTLFPKNGEYGEFRLITDIRTPNNKETFREKTRAGNEKKWGGTTEEKPIVAEEKEDTRKESYKATPERVTKKESDKPRLKGIPEEDDDRRRNAEDEEVIIAEEKYVNKETFDEEPYEILVPVEEPINNCGCSSPPLFSSWLIISFIFIISIIIFIIIYRMV